LQGKVETVYVVPGSDAEGYVPRRFPHKRINHVGNGLRPHSIRGFLEGLPLAFQRDQAEGLDTTYHFTFTGEEDCKATVTIRNKTLHVEDGHIGRPDIHVTADSRTWLGFLAKERSIVWALLRRKIRIKGSPRLLLAFGKCFPS
jgi:alkyl sulfatase BDS1-like metallo-beta-lactamase superfamily hydrolase